MKYSNAELIRQFRDYSKKNPKVSKYSFAKDKLGVERQMFDLYMVENGCTTPRADTLAKMATHLGITDMNVFFVK